MCVCVCRGGGGGGLSDGASGYVSLCKLKHDCMFTG